MRGGISFWFVVILLAAWPLIVVALFGFTRRFPSGIPQRKRWVFLAALSVVYSAASVFHLITGAYVRGFSFVAVAIGTAAWALDLRRRWNASGEGGSQQV